MTNEQLAILREDLRDQVGWAPTTRSLVLQLLIDYDKQRAEIDSLRDYKNALLQAHDMWKSQWQEAQVEIDQLRAAMHYSYPENKLAQNALDGKEMS